MSPTPNCWEIMTTYCCTCLGLKIGIMHHVVFLVIVVQVWVCFCIAYFKYKNLECGEFEFILGQDEFDIKSDVGQDRDKHRLYMFCLKIHEGKERGRKDKRTTGLFSKE